MWLASDDWLDKDYAARCIERLEAIPEASLAFGRVEMRRFPAEEPFLAYSAHRQFQGTPARRLNLVYRSFPDVYIYGVMRTQMAQSTGGFRHVPAADIAFVRRLSLVGPFVNVPDATFHYCTGSQWKSMDQIIASEGVEQLPAQTRPWRGQRSLRLMMDTIHAINERPMPAKERFTMLSGVVVAEVDRMLKRVLVDALGLILPKSRRADVGFWIHKRWMAKEDPEIRNRALYLKRVVLPSLGWPQ